MPRKLKNFLDGYTSYLDQKGAPKLFIKWSGIFTIAAALERKVWIEHERGITYPSQYILLTGPAGVGKGLCLNTAYDLLETLSGNGSVFHIAPTSVSKASLMDALADAERTIIRPMENPSMISFNSITAIPNELAVFLPSWESDFMNVLTDLWDNKRYTETRRTRSVKIDVPKAQINLLSGTTPAYLGKFIPEGAWEEGFMSRTIIVYSGDVHRIDIFKKKEKKKELWNDLVHDLKDIYSMYGEMQVTDEFAEAVHEWSRGGQQPVPDHPKLVGYCTRREAHLLKLCIVAAAANDSELVLTLDHFIEALDWLLELERVMPDIFKAIRTGGDGQAMKECWHFAFQYFTKRGTVVPERLIYAFLQEKVPAHSIERIITVMCKTQLLKEQFAEDGGKGYLPRGKA